MRGFGRCPFGGELLLMEKAAARSDPPGETGRPMAGRPVEREGSSPPMGERVGCASSGDTCGELGRRLPLRVCMR